MRLRSNLISRPKEANAAKVNNAAKNGRENHKANQKRISKWY
jgi:hypothetical protein